PALVQYRNIDKIYLRIVKTSREEIQRTSRMRQRDMVNFYIKKAVVSNWETSLPGDGDFQTHSAEIKIGRLEAGEYMLLASNSSAFDFGTRLHAVAYNFFTVTTVSYVHRQRGNEGYDFYLLHRENGQPLSGADAQVWYREYNRSSRAYVYKKGPRYRTDSDGYFNIPLQRGNNAYRNNFNLEFTSPGDDADRLYVQQNFYLSRHYDPTYQHTRTFFFTDRGIYRPGQPLHFKGIMLQVDSLNGENSRILPNRSSRVTLYDVNNQVVSHLDLTTNEFGTFSGTFQLPVGRLNGNMRIADSYGNTNFSVEEYKRPKFQVLFDPMKESFKLGDTVTVKGRAAAYAGYNIDNADVKYRVVRQVFYPYSWCMWYWRPPDSPTMEILNEVTKTDAKGEFEITFSAVPDLAISKESLPAFNFIIYAEVTDINGENQRSSKTVPIGYTALKIGLNLPGELEKTTGPDTFSISSTTLSGDFIPAAGEISFYRLKVPRRVFRHKLWATPDRTVIEQAEYYKHFPHESWADEANFLKWEKGKRIFQGAFDTEADKTLKLKAYRKWKPGKYLMEMTSKDSYGRSVQE
ncbi:MAG: hypothetical protein GY950_37600, partial [bacterium]|nr:hypothetical protein [bacterium]